MPEFWGLSSSVNSRGVRVEMSCVLGLLAAPSARCRVSVCECNEAKEKSFVLPSDSAAPSTSLELTEHKRGGVGLRGEDWWLTEIDSCQSQRGRGGGAGSSPPGQQWWHLFPPKSENWLENYEDTWDFVIKSITYIVWLKKRVTTLFSLIMVLASQKHHILTWRSKKNGSTRHSTKQNATQKASVPSSSACMLSHSHFSLSFFHSLPIEQQSCRSLSEHSLGRRGTM